MDVEDFKELLSDATAEAERAGAEAADAADPLAAAKTPEPAPAPEPEVDAAPTPEAAPAPEPDAEQEPWYKKRIDTLTDRRDRERSGREAAEARVKELEAALAAGGQPVEDAPKAGQEGAPRVYTQEDVQREAKRVAAADAFTKQCNTVWEDGVKAYGKDFQAAVGNLKDAGLIGPENVTLIQALLETDAAAMLLNHLGKDPTAAEKLLNMSPFKMGAELTRMADRLSKPSAPPPISRAPAPIDPIGAARPKDTVNLADENTPDSEFFSEFEKQLFKR